MTMDHNWDSSSESLKAFICIKLINPLPMQHWSVETLHAICGWLIIGIVSLMWHWWLLPWLCWLILDKCWLWILCLHCHRGQWVPCFWLIVVFLYLLPCPFCLILLLQCLHWCLYWLHCWDTHSTFGCSGFGKLSSPPCCFCMTFLILIALAAIAIILKICLSLPFLTLVFGFEFHKPFNCVASKESALSWNFLPPFVTN